MTALRQIPLHVLLLAGLVAEAQETSPRPAAPKVAPAASAVPAAPAPAPAGPVQPYVGVNVLPLSNTFRERELATELPEGVGIVVGFVDPKGPAAGLVQEKDVLTRLDDQVLVNAEQFRTLIRTRKPGQSVKLVRLRGADVDTVDVPLAARPLNQPLAAAPRPAATPDAAAPGGVRITINGQEVDPSQMIGGGSVAFGTPGAPGGQVVIVGPGAANLPAEIRQQLEAMRQRGLPVPAFELEDLPADPAAGATPVPAPARSGATTFSRSFSIGGGTLMSGGASYTDGQGSVSVRNEGGRKFATLKDAQGEVLFDDEITTPEQLQAVPEAHRARIALVDGPTALPSFRRPSPPPAAGPAPGQDTKPATSPAPAKSRKPIDPREGA
jgi:hypothetical protein